jgi:uncharacterized protein (DUF58 family)
MALKLTRRGLLVLSLAITSLAISVTTSDVLMLGFSLTLLSLVAADALHAYVTTRTRCTCVKCDEVYRGWVWKERELTVELGCGGALGVARSPSWVRVLGTTVDRGRVVVNLRTSFRFYGRYRLWLEVLRGGRLGLCRAVEHVDSGPEFVVYPETLYWVLRALALLGLRGGFTVEPSGAYTYALADAGEYVGSREYALGSSLRRIDWRSTAKFGRLYVKEFSLGEAPSEVLLVDPRCIGRYTCDRIASAVLSVALSRYGAEFPLAVCRTDGGGCRVFSGGRELLLYVLDLVLKLGVVDCDQLYEFVKPTAAEAIRKLLGGSGRGVAVAERDALARADTLYVVSTLLHDARSVLDLLDSVRRRGVRCVVLTAPRPWLDARSLSEAYAIYRSFTNVVEALRSSGAEVVAADRWGR